MCEMNLVCSWVERGKMIINLEILEKPLTRATCVDDNNLSHASS